MSTTEPTSFSWSEAAQATTEAVGSAEPMTLRHVTARTWIRGGLAGGSNPQIYACDDGHQYVVKVPTNPQGKIILANEAVGALCLDFLHVLHPKAALVALTSSGGAGQSSSAQAICFGSEYWDSVPEEQVTISDVSNRTDIAGTFVLDTWLRNSDARQYRAVVSTIAGETRQTFFPVDQGCLIAQSWSASTLAAECNTMTAAPNPFNLTYADAEPFVDRLSAFDFGAARCITSQLPDEWLHDDDRPSLEQYLVRRACLVGSVLAATLSQR